MKFLSVFLLCLNFSSVSAVNAAEIINLSSDRASYSVGDKAVLRAMLGSKPDNETMELDVEAEIEGAILPITRITDFEFFSVTSPLAAGTYHWRATVYLQDARLARDLKASLSYFDTKIAEIDAQLAQATDPQVIAQLQAERARNVSLKSSTNEQLSDIRTKIYGPVGINFSVN